MSLPILIAVVIFIDRRGLPVLANFRSLLASPARYGLRVFVPKQSQAALTLPAAMFAGHGSSSRAVSYNMKDLADIGPLGVVYELADFVEIERIVSLGLEVLVAMEAA